MRLSSGNGTSQGNTYYYSLAGRLVGELTGTTPKTNIFLTDPLGSVLATFSTTAGAAALLGNQVYGPYGTQRYSSGGTMGTNKGFTGQYNDTVTGLDYYNARYYDPVVGVFLAADTVQGNPQGMNPYAYVGGNPETKNDPTGNRQVGACDPYSGVGCPLPPSGPPSRHPQPGPQSNCDPNSGIDCPPPPLLGGGPHTGKGNGFPEKPNWTYRNKDAPRPYQVWMSYLEYDDVAGWHVNLHFTDLKGGGKYGDIHDYHITFDASSPSDFIWRVYDSVTKTEKIYTWYKPFDSGPEDIPYLLQTSLEDTVGIIDYEILRDISEYSDINQVINDPNLPLAGYGPIGDALLWVAQKGLGMAVSPEAFQP